ncbi:NUDIX domain-containing protein [Patescibacteria group bacterium]|nr:NUDIX domain-containing protein [Patescibacteria group bacterium]MBU1673392.1 NUDIX domain-containing protein [Patescibacteria group bacterium]MBU1963282.1 NUDIX domain-containing protein [Patescibacteria group bacterium]
MKFSKTKPKQKLPTKQVKSVGAVIINSKNEVLIMFQKQNRYWELPKGKTEPGENEMETLRREIEEETGLSDLEVFEDARNSFSYKFTLHGHLINKRNVYYIARVKNSKVKLSHEHLDYKWVGIEEVNKLFKHKNQKVLVNKVKDYLKEHGVSS